MTFLTSFGGVLFISILSAALFGSSIVKKNKPTDITDYKGAIITSSIVAILFGFISILVYELRYVFYYSNNILAFNISAYQLSPLIPFIIVLVYAIIFLEKSKGDYAFIVACGAVGLGLAGENRSSLLVGIVFVIIAFASVKFKKSIAVYAALFFITTIIMAIIANISSIGNLLFSSVLAGVEVENTIAASFLVELAELLDNIAYLLILLPMLYWGISKNSNKTKIELTPEKKLIRLKKDYEYGKIDEEEYAKSKAKILEKI